MSCTREFWLILIDKYYFVNAIFAQHVISLIFLVSFGRFDPSKSRSMLFSSSIYEVINCGDLCRIGSIAWRFWFPSAPFQLLFFRLHSHHLLPVMACVIDELNWRTWSEPPEWARSRKPGSGWCDIGGTLGCTAKNQIKWDKLNKVREFNLVHFL